MDTVLGTVSEPCALTLLFWRETARDILEPLDELWRDRVFMVLWRETEKPLLGMVLWRWTLLGTELCRGRLLGEKDAELMRETSVRVPTVAETEAEDGNRESGVEPSASESKALLSGGELATVRRSAGRNESAERFCAV